MTDDATNYEIISSSTSTYHNMATIVTSHLYRTAGTRAPPPPNNHHRVESCTPHRGSQKAKWPPHLPYDLGAVICLWQISLRANFY